MPGGDGDIWYKKKPNFQAASSSPRGPKPNFQAAPPRAPTRRCSTSDTPLPYSLPRGQRSPSATVASKNAINRRSSLSCVPFQSDNVLPAAGWGNPNPPQYKRALSAEAGRNQDHSPTSQQTGMIQHTGRAVTSAEPADASPSSSIPKRLSRTNRRFSMQDRSRDQALDLDFPDTGVSSHSLNPHAPPPPPPTLLGGLTPPPKTFSSPAASPSGKIKYSLRDALRVQGQMQAYNQKAEEVDQPHHNHGEQQKLAAVKTTAEQTNNNEAIMMGRHQLAQDMNSNIQSLNDKLQRQRFQLEEKNSQIADLDERKGQLDHKRQNLNRDFERAQLSLVQQHESLSHKIDSVSDLQYQIVQLQSKLKLEQMEMEQLEGSLLRNQETVDLSDVELRIATDEHATLGAIRQALEDEKDTLDRDVSNCESELKSLEVIHNLARGDEFQ